MHPKTIITLGKYISVASVILIPLLWIFLKYYDLLLVEFLGLTLYTWFYAISWYAVVFVMAIRPLADLFPKYTILRRLCLWRRAFGILSAIVIVTLLFDKWITNPGSFIQFISFGNWKFGEALAARISELTALILLFTSNNISQKILGKHWKTIQYSSYLYFITGAILAVRYGDQYFVIPSLTIVLLLVLFAMIKKQGTFTSKEQT